MGYVETHGRAETEALLRRARDPAPPRRRVSRHDAARVRPRRGARAPARVILVDELAHTNAPGSRHAKRWQDVAELLDAGIDVYTTLNVQHLESLNDVVAQITGVVVRETVPDARARARPTRSSWSTCRPTTCSSACTRARSTCPRRPQQAVRKLLPQGQPDRAARAGAAAHGRARGRADARLHAASTRSSGPGRRPSGILVCVGPEPVGRRSCAPRKPHGRPARARVDRRPMSRRRRSPPAPEARETGVVQTPAAGRAARGRDASR